MDEQYTEIVKDHFFNPRNVGEIKHPDGVGTVGNPTCGDVMTIYLRIKNNHIEDVKFKTYGCAAAIASTSITTEMVKGMSLEKAEKLTRADIAKALGGLPKFKMHCSNLATDALKEAIQDYRKKKETK